MIKPIHPFPARMAAEFVWQKLPNGGERLRVLDPMTGSGTTLVAARLRGHEAIGFDRDPLAVLIANAWASDVDAEATQKKAHEVLARAKDRVRNIAQRDAYPSGASEETKDFVRYWFDVTNRRQLKALADSISRVRNEGIKRLLWCALSRLIITKQSGVSLAMDISHSRPHKSYTKSPINAFDHFQRSVKRITKSAPFNGIDDLPRASVESADARNLPLQDESVDMIITSPPYLNAIDYLRGHKFSLVWMGHDVSELRELRSTNVGAEVSADTSEDDEATECVMAEMCGGDELKGRNAGMLRRYVRDLRQVVRESFRVLRPAGTAIYVVGNCNLRNTFIENSRCVIALANEVGLNVRSTRRRPLPQNRRYLPPPGKRGAGAALHKRMREEVVLALVKQ
jgi:SAM-dependent methyltransferase